MEKARELTTVYHKPLHIFITALITLLNICWETFTNPRRSVGLGSVSRKRFILSPKIKECVLGISVLYDTFVTVFLLAPLLRGFLAKPIISRYFKRFLVTPPSAEMTKGYIDTLLNYQVSLISRAKFSYL